MFCIHCGALNPEDASFCSTCGKAIGARTNPPPLAEAPQSAPSCPEKSFGSAAASTLAPFTLPAQHAPEPQYLLAAAAKGRPVLWVLAGFGSCLLILIAVALGFRLSQPSSTPEPSRNNGSPDPAPTTAPVTYTPPATAPATDTTPAPTGAPVQPEPTPSPAAPQNPIVGEWKATTFIGTSIVLHFGADGRYTLKDISGTEQGVYVFSSGDGTLRLQPNAVFSHNIVVWNCQLSGDTFSCVDPDGAGHVYARQ
jgi:hypothetical protein